VEALVDNKDRALKPGTFARAKVVIGTNESVAYVPETAVSNVAGVTKVFVVEDGRAKARDVEVLRKRGSDALISGPLKDGDALVLTAISRLFDGTEVKVDNAAPEATERKPDAAGEGKPRAKPTGKEASNAGAAQ
jgi:membrane fusion protein (multidrug efflux system)